MLSCWWCRAVIQNTSWLFRAIAGNSDYKPLILKFSLHFQIHLQKNNNIYYQPVHLYIQQHRKWWLLSSSHSMLMHFTASTYKTGHIFHAQQHLHCSLPHITHSPCTPTCTTHSALPTTCTAFHNPGFHPYTCLFSISFCNLFQLFSQVLFQNIQISLLIIVHGLSVEMTREKVAVFSDDLMYCSNHVSQRLNQTRQHNGYICPMKIPLEKGKLNWL